MEENYELVLKAKIRAAPLPTVLHSPHPTPETRSRYLPSTPIISSTIPLCKCFKSYSPMSDLKTNYGPQAQTRFTCLV